MSLESVTFSICVNYVEYVALKYQSQSVIVLDGVDSSTKSTDELKES